MRSLQVVRISALAALAVLPRGGWADTAEKCNSLLETALASKNPDTRQQAVVALSLANRGPWQARLDGMLADNDVQVRLAVVAGLAEQRNTRAVASLRKALEDEVPEVSFAAAKALYALDDPAGKKALLAVLQGETKTSSGFFTKEKRQALRMMHTPVSTFLYAVWQGAGFAPVPGLGEGISSMQAIMTDPNVSGRAAAALMLGKDRTPATVTALEDALYDNDWRVRAAAVHSLALQNDPRKTKDLEPLLEDDKEQVRLRAAAGWLRLNWLRRK